MNADHGRNGRSPSRTGQPLTLAGARTEDHATTITAQLREGTFGAMAPSRSPYLRFDTPKRYRRPLRDGRAVLIFLISTLVTFTACLTLTPHTWGTALVLALAAGAAALELAMTTHDRRRRAYALPIGHNRVAAGFLYEFNLVQAEVHNAVRSDLPSAAAILDGLHHIRPIYEKLVIDLVALTTLEVTTDAARHRAAHDEVAHARARLTEILAEAHAAADVVAMRTGRLDLSPTDGLTRQQLDDARQALPDSPITLDEHRDLHQSRKQLRVDLERLDSGM